MALLGYGWIAERHARAALEADGAELVHVAGPNGAAAAAFAARFGAPASSDGWRAAVEDERVGAVVVCSPNVWHAEQAVAALEAGRHVLVEKPMALSAEEGVRMAAAAARAERVLAVAHLWRFRAEVEAFRDRVLAGDLGRVVRTRSHAAHLDFGPGGWFVDRARSGGGALIDLGVHAIDTVRFVLGEPTAARVRASLGPTRGAEDVDDDGVLLIDWEGGVRSVVEFGWWQPQRPGLIADTEVYGTAGYGRIWPPEPDEGYEHAPQSTYTAQLQGFVDACLGRPTAGAVTARGTLAAGLATLEIVDAAYADALPATVEAERGVTAAVAVGVDAGATKTAVVVCRLDGEVLAVGAGGSGAWEYVGLDAALATVAATIREAVHAAGAAAGDVAAGGFALSGVDWPEDDDVLGAALDRLGLPGRRVVLNDAFAALRAGAPGGVGCVSCAGTGTITAGTGRDGTSTRTFGAGLGERGGALDLVADALDAVVLAEQGLGPPTALSADLLAALDVPSTPELVRRLYRAGLVVGPEHAPLVSAAAAAGDAVAAAILADAGASLARTACAVAGRLGLLAEAFVLVRAGSVHRHAGPPLVDAFVAVIQERAPSARVELLQAPPAAGAALRALDLLGPADATIERRVVEGAAGLAGVT